MMVVLRSLEQSVLSGLYQSARSPCLPEDGFDVGSSIAAELPLLAETLGISASIPQALRHSEYL